MSTSSSDETSSSEEEEHSIRRHETLSDAAPTESSSEGSETSTVLEDEELSEIEAFDDVNVEQLCALPITEQQRIVERVKQIEADRSTEELMAAHGKPEAFSALSMREFLREAQFDIKVSRCRSQFAQGVYDETSPSSKVRRIATDSTRRYIFEKVTDKESETRDGSGVKLWQSTEATKSSLGPAIGRMMPGESIVDGCLRLKRERNKAAPPLPTDPTQRQSTSKKDEPEWEDLPVQTPSK